MNNIDALKNLYTTLGGELSDSYEDIAGGVPVSDYATISDSIQAVSKKAGSSGGSEPFVIPVTWDADNSIFKTTVTAAELAAAFTDNPFNVYFDITLSNGKTKRYLRATTGGNGNAVAVYTQTSPQSGMYFEQWKCGTFGPQGFGIYYESFSFTINQDHTAGRSYTAIPEVT